MFGSFFQTVTDWLPWLGLGTGTLIGAAWWFGLMPVIGAAAQVVAKFLGPFAEALGAGVVWLWQNILWPGLRGMLDGIPQIITFSLIVGGLYLYTVANKDIQLNHANKQLGQCRVELKKVKKTLPAQSEPQLWEFRFPWQ